MRLKKDKRASILGEFIADFIAFMCYIAILVLFFVLFSLTISMRGCFNQDIGMRVSMVSESSNNLNEEMILLNYLRTAVDVNGEQMSVAELIALSYSNNDYTMLEEKTKEIFGQIDQQIHDKDRCSVVCIYVDQTHVKEVRTDYCQQDMGFRCWKTKATIPLFYTQPPEQAVVWFSYNTYWGSDSGGYQ